MIRNTEILGAGLPNVWHACSKWHTERFRWHATFTLLPFLFLFLVPDQLLYIVKNMCMCMCTRARARAHTHTHTHTHIYIHTSDCLETVYELPPLTNNNALKHFYTNQER